MPGLPSKKVVIHHLVTIGICILIGYLLGVLPFAALAAVITTILRFITGATKYTQPLFHFAFVYVPVMIIARAAKLLGGLLNNLPPESLFFVALGLLFIFLRIGLAVIYQPRPQSAPFRPVASKTTHDLLRKITTGYLVLLSVVFAIFSLFIPSWPIALTVLLVTLWELFYSTNTGVRIYIKTQSLFVKNAAL